MRYLHNQFSNCKTKDYYWQRIYIQSNRKREFTIYHVPKELKEQDNSEHWAQTNFLKTGPLGHILSNKESYSTFQMCG